MGIFGRLFGNEDANEHARTRKIKEAVAHETTNDGSSVLPADVGLLVACPGGGDHDWPLTGAYMDADSWTFAVCDLRDPSSFAGKVKQPVDALSTYVRGRLSDATREALANWPDSSPVSEPIQDTLVRDLNTIIWGESIYGSSTFIGGERLEKPLFAGVTLRPLIGKLLFAGAGLSRRGVAVLNRLLLEDAYPLELSRNRNASDTAWWDLALYHRNWPPCSKCGMDVLAFIDLRDKRGSSRDRTPSFCSAMRARHQWVLQTLIADSQVHPLPWNMPAEYWLTLDNPERVLTIPELCRGMVWPLMRMVGWRLWWEGDKDRMRQLYAKGRKLEIADLAFLWDELGVGDDVWYLSYCNGTATVR